MMLDVLLLVAVCFFPSFSLHCEDDIGLDDVQEYSVQIDNVKDLDYWRTAQNSFQVYGKFDGDPSSSVIQAGYYTSENRLIYGLTVDCGSGKWSSQVTQNNTDTVVDWLQGDLARVCESDAIFDIWFKVHQPRMMSWIFNGQALQFETRKSYFRRGIHQRIERTRPLKVYTKYGSNQGKYFRVAATGAAKFTRLSWGQCLTWPRSLSGNCQAARQWVLARSKMATTVKPFPGLGPFGANMPTFAPVCFKNSKYFNYVQRFVHPDRNSQGYPYCCCVDMITGQTDDESDCTLPGSTVGCPKSCETDEYARKDLIDEVLTEKDSVNY